MSLCQSHRGIFSRFARVILCGVMVGWCVPAVEAATPSEEPFVVAQAQEVDREPPAEESLRAHELVQAIKLRAQREIARRRAKRWSVSNLATWTVGNESNPGLLKQRSSAVFTKEYLSTTLHYRFLTPLTGQFRYSFEANNYNEATDLSTVTNTLMTKLTYRLAKPFTFETNYTFNDINYPYDDGSSTWEQSVHMRLRHRFLQNAYHYAGWTWLYKQYQDKLKRDGVGTRVAGKLRKDDRHTVHYEIGGTIATQNRLALLQEFYFHDSNEAFQDFNDAQDYKVKLSVNRDWTEQWRSSSSFTYELKRYERRNVTARGVAQQDYTKMYQHGVTYKLNKTFDLAYTWKYKKNDSNDTAQAYQDITNSLALTAAF